MVRDYFCTAVCLVVTVGLYYELPVMKDSAQCQRAGSLFITKIGGV